jgi:hypothetical protein
MVIDSKEKAALKIAALKEEIKNLELNFFLHDDVLALIKRSGAKGLTVREMNNLSRNFKRLTEIEKNEVLTYLEVEGFIESSLVKSHSGRGAAKTIWLAN